VREVRGKITITPPLSWLEFKDSALYHEESLGPPWRDEREYVHLDVVSTMVDTAEGPLTRREAGAILPPEGTWPREEGPALIRELVLLVDTTRDKHAYDGELIFFGIDTGDISRVVIKDNRAVFEQAAIMWPDGSRLDLTQELWYPRQIGTH
jgi:hypothetical protein